MASKTWVRRGSLGGRAREAVVRRMVRARRVFFAQGIEASDSRFWALERIARKHWRQPMSWAVVADEGESGTMLCRKRLMIGKAWGTTSAWQMPVPRIAAKMWRMLAWRSVLMMEGKIAEASTRASREFRTSVTLSSCS